MSGSRTVYSSGRYRTLILEEEGQKVVYKLDDPNSVGLLFRKHGFPDRSHVGSGIKLEDGPLGPVVVLHRTYEQKMPGQAQPERLIWCCKLMPDQDAQPPSILTPLEAGQKFGIRL